MQTIGAARKRITPSSPAAPIQRKQVILLTQRLHKVGAHKEVRVQLDKEWGILLNELNVVGVPLMYGTCIADYFDTFDVAGVILTGGNDLSVAVPATPGTVATSFGSNWRRTDRNDEEHLNMERDHFEEEVAALAEARRIPILGVCRGHQFLCARAGASLVQVKDHVAVTHSLTMASSESAMNDWWVEWRARNPSREVNSYHNYGVIAGGGMVHEGGLLQPVLFSMEGHVEAVQSAPGKPPVLGIMWHPERNLPGRSLALSRKAREANKALICRLFELPLPTTTVVPPRAVVLCAGQGTRLRPLTDTVPKCMVKFQGHCIIDYILASLRVNRVDDICLIKGYLAEVLVRQGVRYAVNENYMTTNMVTTLFCAEHELDHGGDVIISYSDIIYVPLVVETLLASTADISVVVDKDWLQQWGERMEDPLSDAETLKLSPEGLIIELGKTPKSYDDIAGQYIGLVKFSPRGMAIAREFYHGLDKPGAMIEGRKFLDMHMTGFLQAMIDSGIPVHPVWINGGWTECDAPEDLEVTHLDVSPIPVLSNQPKLKFGTKAETLEMLGPLLTNAVVAPLMRITMAEWQNGDSRDSLLAKAATVAPAGGKLIVRSSATSEDTATCSNAGAYLSLDGVSPEPESLTSAISEVFASFGNGATPDDQVLVQLSLTPVKVCGVLFTADLESHQRYYTLSYDTSGATDTITGGKGNGDTMVTTHRLKTSGEPPDGMPVPEAQWERQLYAMAEELQHLFDNQAIDIEFAVSSTDQLYLLQARPLTTTVKWEDSINVIRPDALAHYHRKVFNKVSHHLQSTHIDLPGDKTILGVMSDWNPAEMIGLRPRQLASSLYKELVTDRVAMASRSELGYRRTTGFPLMLTLLGRPYIDLRVTFCSFIPADLDLELAHKLVSYYIDKVKHNPELHDKVEFDVCFTCAYPGLTEKMCRELEEASYPAPFTRSETDRFRFALLTLTNRLLDPKLDVIRRELDKIEQMEMRRVQVMTSNHHMLQKIFLLVEDIKFYGTQAFANLARFGFMAKQLLSGLVETGAMSARDEAAFMCSLNTVSRQLAADQARMEAGLMSRDDFLSQYGHLRPGTYDIMSKRYSDDFELYFGSSMSASLSEDPSQSLPEQHNEVFELSSEGAAAIAQALLEAGLRVSVEHLFSFMRGGILGREYGKFIFTKAVSDILGMFGQLGEEYCLTLSDMSYVQIGVLHKLYTELEMTDLGTLLRRAVDIGREQHNTTAGLQLPLLITSCADVYSWKVPKDVPNFVTSNVVQGNVICDPTAVVAAKGSLEGTIVCILNADPGWDWLFTKKIGGLITCFGGANSHMTIRAAELNLPAVIGAGTSRFAECSRAVVLRIDCKSRSVQMIR